MASLRSGAGPGQEDEEADDTDPKAGNPLVQKPKGSLSLVKPRPVLVVLDLDKTVCHLAR